MPSRPWRLRIRHSTGYRYGADVTASHNEVRLTPAATDRQWLLEHRIDVEPAARLSRFADYWGTVVHAFDLRRTHRELSIVAVSHVETTPAPVPGPDTLGWDTLDDADVRDLWCEMLMPTPYTESDDAIAALAEELRARPSPSAAVESVVAMVHDRLEYERGTTHVGTSAAEALAAGAGVCQDFAHLTLAILRRAGIPCRYDSGYLMSTSTPQIGEATAGESHAWVEAWVGDWVALDPTNTRTVGREHVLVGRGRDYADVPPLRGIYHGGHAEALEVEVEICRTG